jgi:hypothetical protein
MKRWNPGAFHPFIDIARGCPSNFLRVHATVHVPAPVRLPVPENLSPQFRVHLPPDVEIKENRSMPTRFLITLLVMLMTNAVLFGIGAVAVLSIPLLNAHAMVLLPLVIVLSLVLGPITAWYIAPRLRARYWNERRVAARPNP